MIMPDGSIRDSAYFSVIAEEWPAFKAALVAGLQRDPRSSATLDRDILAGASTSIVGARDGPSWADDRITIARRHCLERLHRRHDRHGDRLLRADVPAPFVSYDGDLIGLVIISVIFGVVNGFIGPIVRTLALPLRLITLGLVGFLINGGLLLLTAAISGAMHLDLKIGDFPPDL